MTSELQASSCKLEALLQSDSERASLPTYLLPAEPCAETESCDEREEGDEEEDEDIAMSDDVETQAEGAADTEATKQSQRSHTLLIPHDSSKGGGGEERQSALPPSADRPVDLGRIRMTTRGLSRRSSAE
jgi:hypothetical protein